MRRVMVTLPVFLFLYAGIGLASEDKLAEHSKWLSLLHFERGSFFSGSRSAVLDKKFFLAKNGNTDPKAELIATLAELRKPPVEGKLHASCRFPARALWLARMTGERWPQVKCPEWDKWKQEHSNAEVGVILASGYLGNPASFFGHLLLHLEKNNADQNTPLTKLLDTSLNFGANIPEDDGLVMYMVKGLFGGYEAKFSRAPFYRNTTLYSEREMRDLWHYRLALSAAERELLIAHIFEIIGHDYKYLFLNDNCASRIARTLELVVEDNLIQGYAPWVAPETVVRSISKAEVRGKPLLKSVHYVPSRRLMTEWRYQALSVDEQLAAREVWPNISTLNLQSERYLKLPPARRAFILDTLLGHVAFLKQAGSELNLDEINRQLLHARLQLPGGGETLEPRDAVPLHEATPSSLMRLEGIYNNKKRDKARLTLRPLQYDLLDSNTTRMPHAALEIGRSELNIARNGLYLRKFEFFHITNLHAQSVQLPALPNLVWHASGGIESTHLDCDRCLDGHLDLLAGKSYKLGHHLPFFMAGGQLRTERHQSGFFAPMAQLGVLSDWMNDQRTLIQITRYEGLKGEPGLRTRWLLQHRVGLGRKWDLRAGMEGNHDVYELSLGLSAYF